MKLNERKVIWYEYGLVLAVLAIVSYGFVDYNLHFSRSVLYTVWQQPLFWLFHDHRVVAGAIYTGILGTLFFLWFRIVGFAEKVRMRFSDILAGMALVYGLLLFAYPATTYDLFNYMATAKVAFTHRENPYLVMPVEIPNDPDLAYTRAANKVALYGPTWIALTAVPNWLGHGNVWITMILFKLVVVAALFLTAVVLFRISGSVSAVAWFVFNPLVMLEVGMCGHNDIVMILLALFSLGWKRAGEVRKTVMSGLAFLLSVLVKGASLVLVPALVLRLSKTGIWRYAYWSLLAVFLVAAPLREELYPWYAVWFLPFAALLPGNLKLERGLSVALSIGLELRPVPYIVMGYYEGPGPLLRTLLTFIPVFVFAVFFGIGYLRGRVSGKQS